MRPPLPPGFELDYDTLFAQADQDNGLPSGMTRAIAEAETGFLKTWDRRNRARSPVGAVGPMQFMPATGQRFGLQSEADLMDPVKAIPAAGKYLGALYQEFGTPELTAAAYNAGEGAVRKHKGVPPYKETQGYVPRVMKGLMDFMVPAAQAADVPRGGGVMSGVPPIPDGFVLEGSTPPIPEGFVLESELQDIAPTPAPISAGAPMPIPSVPGPARSREEMVQMARFGAPQIEPQGDLGQRVMAMRKQSDIGFEVEKKAARWKELDAMGKDGFAEAFRNPRMALTPEQIAAEKNRLMGEIMAGVDSIRQSQEGAPPLTPEVQQSIQALDNLEFQPAMQNLGGIFEQVGLPSILASAPTIAAAIASRQFGRVPAALASFLGSYNMDFGPRLSDAMMTAQNQGPINPQQAIEALSQAENASALVGGAGALGSAVAPGLSRADGIAKTAMKAGGMIAADPLVEGAGEYAAQRMTRNAVSPSDVILEGALGVPGSVADVAGATLARRGAQPQSAPQSAPQADPVPPTAPLPDPNMRPPQASAPAQAQTEAAPQFTAEPDYSGTFPQQTAADFTPQSQDAQPTGKQSAKAYLDEVDKAKQDAPTAGRETITPSQDTLIGRNAEGDPLYRRANGDVYRIRDGRVSFGGDLADFETEQAWLREQEQQQTAPPVPDPQRAADVSPAPVPQPQEQSNEERPRQTETLLKQGPDAPATGQMSEKKTVRVTTRKAEAEMSNAEVAARLKAEYPSQNAQTLYGKFVQARNLKPDITAKEFQSLLDSVTPDRGQTTQDVGFQPTHTQLSTGQKVQVTVDDNGVHRILWENGMTGTKGLDKYAPEGSKFADEFTPVDATPAPPATSTDVPETDFGNMPAWIDEKYRPGVEKARAEQADFDSFSRRVSMLVNGKAKSLTPDQVNDLRTVYGEEAPLESRRESSTEATSNYASDNFDAWKDLHNGDEEAARSMIIEPADRQFVKTKDMVQQRYGFPAIGKHATLVGRQAVDQLLDAYRNLRGLANGLGLSEGQMSLSGQLNLELSKLGARFYGQYTPKPGDRRANIAGRARSFAHEWFHGLDDTLAGLGNKRFLTNTKKNTTQSKEVVDAFRAVRGEVLQGDFLTNAKRLDVGKTPYWATRVEMMARAFEAYAAQKFPGREFIHRGEWYQSPAAANYYPQGADLARITAAFDDFFSKYAEGTGEQAAPGVGPKQKLLESVFDEALPKDQRTEFKKLADDIAAQVSSLKEAAGKPAGPLKKMAKGDFSALDSIRKMHWGIYKSMASAVKEVAKNHPNNPHVKQIFRILTDDPGTGEAYDLPIYKVRVQQENAFSNRLQRIVDLAPSYKQTDEQFQWITRVLTSATEAETNALMAQAVSAGFASKAEAGKLVQQLRSLMNDMYYYADTVLQENGLSLGYTQNGYLPRDVSRRLVDAAGQQQFITDIEAVYGLPAMGRTDPRAAAEYYVGKYYVGDPYSGTILPGEDFAKGRVFPPEADRILEKYYEPNPIERIESYIRKVVPRIEYMRRFGPDGQKFHELLTKSVMHPTDPVTDRSEQNAITALFASAAGRSAGLGPDAHDLNTLGSFWRSMSTMFYLGGATLSSGPEALNIGFSLAEYDGPLKASGTALRALGMNLKQVARQMLSAEETRQEVFLDAIGLTTRTAEAALERFGVEAVADPGKFSRMTHNLFVSNMLNGLTGAQRRTAGIFGMEYFGKFVDDVLEGPNGKRYEAAKKELREYGIPDSEAKAFSDWFKANIRDGIPQGDEFTRFDNTKYGKMYKEGLFAFATRTSLQASLVDKPQLAGKAGANWIYQLLSFAYTFQRQVFWQVVNRAKSAPDARAKYNVIAGAALTHGLILGTTYLITEMIRYPLRGKPERKEDQEINGMLLKMMETFDRGTPLPYTSIALNLAASVKYMHSATERAAGPTGAYMGNILDGYLKFAFANKESTNTAERAAAKSLYMMLAVPTLMVLLSRTPAKTLPMQTAQMLSLMMVSGKRAQDKAADLLAGPKPEKPTGRRTRERRRSAR